MTLSVDVFNVHPKRRPGRRDAVRYVRKALRSSGVERARVTVVFTDSRRLRKMNRQYLHHDHITDVISFPLEEDPVLEGEVYVNLDRARSQAKEYSVSFRHEVARLVVHGTLHLIGFDDSTRREALRMRAEEDRVLRSWF